MISQSVILEEIDNGCYGCYAKGTDGNKIKNNEGVKNLLMNEIKTLEDLESLNNINEYEVDKAFLDKMKYIKEHKNETDNLIYTGGLDFFKGLKKALEDGVAGDLADLKEWQALKEQTEADINEKLSKADANEADEEIENLRKELADAQTEIKKIEDKFNDERDNFMEHYVVPETQDTTDELPASVAEGLCSDDIYIKKTAKAIVILGVNNMSRAFRADDGYTNVKKRQDEKAYNTMFKLMTRKRFSEKYNIFFI